MTNASAAQGVRELAQGVGIPVVTTLMGIGAFDTTDPLALHMLGMHGTAFANYAVDDCDFLIAVGARFDDRVAGVPARFAPNARHIAHLDVDAAEIGKVKPVDWHHVGDLNQALGALCAYLSDRGFRPDYADWHAHIAQLKQTRAMNYERGGVALQPHAVIEETNRQPKHSQKINTEHLNFSPLREDQESVEIDRSDFVTERAFPVGANINMEPPKKKKEQS